MRLSAVDAAWLHMEEPGNLMNVNGVFTFSGPLPWEALRERLRERLLPFTPFHCRVVERWGRRPRWEPDPHFDLDRHLVRCEGRLMDQVGRLLSQPLDRAHPLWQMHCLPTATGWALIARLHHVIGDGVALMHVLGRLADRVPPTYRAPHLDNHASWRTWLDSLLGLVTDVVLRRETPTPLKGRLGRAKRAAVSRPLLLEALSEERHRLGSTLNELLLEAVTTSLRGYLGQPTGPVRIVMPVDLRRPDDEQLGNRFGMAFVPLPVHIADREERRQALRAGLARLKHSRQPLLIYLILALAGSLPGQIESWLVRFFGSRATAVVTNVPGPRETLELLGQPLQELMFWVPQSGRLSLGISLISYAGSVRVGVASDAGLLPHPEELVQGFEQALPIGAP